MTHVLVVGTGNPDKLKEFRRLLAGTEVKVLPIGEFGPVPEVVEDGRTFDSNACKKARAYSRLSPYPTLADDSGLCVRALGNRPGVTSARFAGPGCGYDDNNRKLLKLLGAKPAARRKASFHSSIAVYLKGKRLGVFRGATPGRIAFKAKGKNGFGYDPVFVPSGSTQTYAEMNSAEKNRVSHRGKALAKTRQFLAGYFRGRRGMKGKRGRKRK